MSSCLSVQLGTVSPVALAPASLWRGIYQLHITSITTLSSARHFNIFSSGILSHYQSLSAVLQDYLLGNATARARTIGPGHSLLGLYDNADIKFRRSSGAESDSSIFGEGMSCRFVLSGIH
jgi:hypothetical protein